MSFGGSTDILAMALCKHERPGRVRGIGDFVTPTAYFHMTRGGHSHCQEQIQALRTAISQMKGQFHATSPHVHHTIQSEYGSSNTNKSYDVGSSQLNHMTMENILKTQNDMLPDPKSKTKKVCHFKDHSKVKF